MNILKLGGLGMSPGRFYMLMSELEDKGYVRYRDVPTPCHGRLINQRWFDLVLKEAKDDPEGGSAVERGT